MKQNEKQHNKPVKAYSPIRKSLQISCIVLVSAFILYLSLCIFGAVAAMTVPRRPLTESPVTAGLQYEEVSFHSRGDGVLLKGWFLPASGEAVIMIVNGGFENRVDPLADTLNIARALVDNGYNVLLYDLRGRGESEGIGRSMSNISRDLGGAVDYLKKRGYAAERIGIMGFCSGAASACIYTAEDKVGAVILDGCFTSVYDMVIKQADLRNIPEFLTRFFFSGVQTAASIFYDYQVVNPIDTVGEIKSPVLFIHEENDDLVTTQDTYRMFEISNNSSNEIWEIPEAQHSRGYGQDPDQYTAKLIGFLDTRLGTISRQ